MNILLILLLLSSSIYAALQGPFNEKKDQTHYIPRWAQPSENTQDKIKPLDAPKPFVPPPVDTRQPILKRMDALTLSSNPNAAREETPTPKPKKKASPHTSKKK